MQSNEAATTPSETGDDRRLGDRILAALLLALDQGELAIAEPLATALELALTRVGGPTMQDKRGVPERLDEAYLRLDELRRKAKAA